MNTERSSRVSSFTSIETIALAIDRVKCRKSKMRGLCDYMRRMYLENSMYVYSNINM